MTFYRNKESDDSWDKIVSHFCCYLYEFSRKFGFKKIKCFIDCIQWINMFNQYNDQQIFLEL